MFGKMTWFQAIDTQLIELGTGEQWVFSPSQTTQVLTIPAMKVADHGWKFLLEASL